MANTKDAMEHIAFRVPPEDLEWLDLEAEALSNATRLKVSRSDILRRLITDAREAQAIKATPPPKVQKGQAIVRAVQARHKRVRELVKELTANGEKPTTAEVYSKMIQKGFRGKLSVIASDIRGLGLSKFLK